MTAASREPIAPESRRVVLSAHDRARVDEVDTLSARGTVALPELLSMLGDRSWVVRRAVTTALARAGKEALDGLVRILRERSSDENLLAAAVDALVLSAVDVTSEMTALLDAESEPATLCDVLHVLGRRKASQVTSTIARFAQHPNDNVSLAAIEALGRIGGADTVEPLVEVLRTRQFFRVFPAIDGLGRTGDPRAVEPLIGLVDDPMYSAIALRALGHTGQASAVSTLGRFCAVGSDALVRTAAAALSDLVQVHESRYGFTAALRSVLDEVAGTQASARIRATLVGAVASERVAMASVLGWLGDETSVTALIELLDDDDARSAAAKALHGLGAKAAPIVIQAIFHGDSLTRERLLPLAGHGPLGTDEFAACLSDREPNVRALACEALARRGDTSVVPMLFRLLGDPNPRVTQAASAAIHSLGSQEAKKLALQEARSTDVRVRRAALRILGYFGYPEALDLLIGAIDDDDERSRESAIAGLPLIEDPRAVQTLINATRHAAAKTRGAASRALGQTTASPAVVACLRERLKDSDAWVRYYACQSLAKLKAPGISAEIVACMDDEAGQVRVCAVEALAQLGDDEAVRALSRAATSEDDDIRRAALLGLGIARRPEAIPLVRDALSSSDSSTRLVAVSALSELDSPDVVPLLAKAASDPDEGVRNAAIGFLSTRPGLPATQALIERMSDPETRERVIAALAVAPEHRADGILAALETADHEMARHLISVLLRGRRAAGFAALADVLHCRNAVARRAAVEAIASINLKETDEVLRRAASDPDAEVRRIALMATRR